MQIFLEKCVAIFLHQYSLSFPQWDFNYTLDHLTLFYSSWMFFSGLPVTPPPPYCVSVWIIYINLSLSSLMFSLAMLSLYMGPSQAFFICCQSFNKYNFYLTHPYNSLCWNHTSILACCQTFPLAYLTYYYFNSISDISNICIISESDSVCP